MSEPKILEDLADETVCDLRSSALNYREAIIKHVGPYVTARLAEAADRVRADFSVHDGGSDTIDRVCAAIMGDHVIFVQTLQLLDLWYQHDCEGKPSWDDSKYWVVPETAAMLKKYYGLLASTENLVI